MHAPSLRTAFTIPELLIVLAVFGLALALGSLSLNNARARVRDTQRVADVALVRQALQQYYLEKSGFPALSAVNLGQPGTKTERLSSAGFVGLDDATTPIYLPRVPLGPGSGEYYRYHGGASGYSLRFQTENATDLGKANVYYAHTSGIDQSDEEK